MESKYYTPELKEFAEGFEYEKMVYFGHPPHDVNNFTWRKFVFDFMEDCGEIGYYFRSKTSDKLRVKYLSKECIESLGFYETLPGVFNNTDKDRFQICFDYWLPENDYQFLRLTTCDDENEVDFAGKIKNKHELKILMKQLGII
jgi:hypothetical protein